MWKFDHSYLQLPETFYSKVEETPVQSPKMFMWNDELAKEIGLDDLHEQEKVDVFFRKRATGVISKDCPSIRRSPIWQFHYARRWSCAAHR